MNTIVSAASLTSATVVAAPAALAGELPAPNVGDLSFPDLVARFVKVRERWTAQMARDKAVTERHFKQLFEVTSITRQEWYEMTCKNPRWKETSTTFDKILKEDPSNDPVDEHGASIAWKEIGDDLDPLVYDIIARRPQSLADLAWQAEALIISDAEFREESDGFFEQMHQRLVQNILTLAGPLPIPGGGTSLPIATFAIPTTDPDPIFAAIEAHRKAVKEICIRLDHHCALEEELPPEKCQTNMTPNNREIVNTDDPRWIAADLAVIEGWDVVDETATTLIDVEPTTQAGITALLNYWAELQAQTAISGEVYVLDKLCDDDDPALAKAEQHSAPFGYFVVRNAARTLKHLSV
jgi:hypothetical protein